jgi:DNA-binding XRE family transcriptional regulator
MERSLIVQDVSQADDPQAYKRMEEGHKQFLAAVKNGSAELGDFDPAVPAKAAGSRLKQIFKERGIKQSEMARRLGVAPSVINRMFKHPERSRLETIRKIANAAGIALSELI